MNRFVLTFLVFAPALSFAQSASKSLQTVSEVPEFRRFAGSIAMIIDSKHLQRNSAGTRYSLRWSDANRCGGDPLEGGKRSHGGFCTSFLIAPDKVMTSGHCLLQKKCEEMSFVFGLTTDASSVAAKDVRKCKRVDLHKLPSLKKYKYTEDYAIIELNHPVSDREFLRLSRRPGSRVATAVGHADGGRLRVSKGIAQDETDNGATTTASIITGMSGGPIFNERNEVTGIVSVGHATYENEFGCRVTPSGGVLGRQKDGLLTAPSYVPLSHLPDAVSDQPLVPGPPLNILPSGTGGHGQQ